MVPGRREGDRDAAAGFRNAYNQLFSKAGFLFFHQVHCGLHVLSFKNFYIDYLGFLLKPYVHFFFMFF